MSRADSNATHLASSGKRILHYGGEWSYWDRLAPNCLDDPKRGQIAGGETAMLRAAYETAARGNEVHVVTWCSPGRHRGVAFHDRRDFYDLVLDGGPWDAVVIWGEPAVLATLTASGALTGTLRICAQQCNGFYSPGGSQGYVDLYVSPSMTHARMLSARYGIPIEKFVAIPNAIEPSRYRNLGTVPRNPFAVYYASSPDRGLHHLLELWPEIKKAEPGAELHVYYEYKRFLKDIAGRDSHPIMFDLGKRLTAAINRVAHGYGVTMHGGSPQQVVADRAISSGVMAYPCDTIMFTEGFGTAVLEAYVAGACPVTTDTDAFGEVYGPLFPLIPRADVRKRLVPAVLAGIESARARAQAGKAGWAFDTIAEAQELQKAHSWARVGGLWCDLITGSGSRAAA